jgi:hypothetical protein
VEKEQVCDAIREREMGQADKSWTETIMGDTQSIRKWVERDFIFLFFLGFKGGHHPRRKRRKKSIFLAG